MLSKLLGKIKKSEQKAIEPAVFALQVFRRNRDNVAQLSAFIVPQLHNVAQLSFRLRLAIHHIANSLQIPLLYVNIFLIFISNYCAWEPNIYTITSSH